MPDVIAPDGTLTPIFIQAFSGWFRHVLTEALGASAKRDIIVPPLFTSGTVKSVDIPHGLVTVLCDHDLVGKAETDAAPVTADLVGSAIPTAGQRVVVVFTDGKHLCLGAIGSPGSATVGGTLMVGGPDGIGSSAYLGNIQRWNSLEWSIAMTADGRLIFNHKNNGGYTEFREENGSGGTLAWLHGRMSGGLAEITVPQYLTTVSGVGLSISTSGSHQVGLTPGSTARIKRNLREVPLDTALDMLRRFRLLTFNYRDDLPGILDDGTRAALALPHYGFTAEEVHAWCPELAHLDGDGVPVAVKYEQMIPLAVGAIQELLARNIALQHAVEELRDRLDDLQAKVDALVADRLGM